MNAVYHRSLELVCITGWHFSTEGRQTGKTAIPNSPQHFLHWLKAMIKGQWWANRRQRWEEGRQTHHASQTVGCVTIHTFNYSPSGTKAGGEHTLILAHGYFSLSDPQQPKMCYFGFANSYHYMCRCGVDGNKPCYKIVYQMFLYKQPWHNCMAFICFIPNRF